MMELIKTGIDTLDNKILEGGIPLYSINLISGRPGSGKTCLCQQILFNNAAPDTRCLYFTTVSEPTAKIIRYQQAFDYFDEQKIKDGLFTYVDIGSIIYKKGLSAGIEIIIDSIEKFNARIVAIDSFKAINDMAESPASFRHFAYSLCVEMVALRCTSFLVGEYTQEAMEKEPIFAIADGIIHLNLHLEEPIPKRTLNIVKMRGVGYFEGFHSISISTAGVLVFPRVKTPPSLSFSLSCNKITTGVSGIDKMSEGGFPIGSSTLLMGGTGAGKTTLSLHFLMEGIKQGESVLLVSFQETPDQLKIMAKTFGWDIEEEMNKKKFSILYTSPVELNFDKHGFLIKEAVGKLAVKRVVIDSLMDLKISALSDIHLRDYIYSLINFFKALGVTSVLTNEATELFEKANLSLEGILSIADNVIILNYKKEEHLIKREILLLKMRGSNHEKEIKEFEITNKGVVIK